MAATSNSPPITPFAPPPEPEQHDFGRIIRVGSAVGRFGNVRFEVTYENTSDQPFDYVAIHCEVFDKGRVRTGKGVTRDRRDIPP